MDCYDPMQTCPYDEAHRVIKSGMQRHIVKCRRNNRDKDMNMSICIFNATHVIPTIEYQYHLENCLDAREIVAFTHSTNDAPMVGQVSIEEIQNQVVPCTENWDAEPEVENYNPDEHIQDRKILRNIHCVPKSEKKKFRIEERSRFAKLEAQSSELSQAKPDTKNTEWKKPAKAKENVNNASRVSYTSELANVASCSKTVKQTSQNNEKSAAPNNKSENVNEVKELIEKAKALSMDDDKTTESQWTTIKSTKTKTKISKRCVATFPQNDEPFSLEKSLGRGQRFISDRYNNANGQAKPSASKSKGEVGKKEKPNKYFDMDAIYQSDDEDA